MLSWQWLTITPRALLVTEGQRLTKLCDEWDVKLEQNKEKINEDIQVLHLF